MSGPNSNDPAAEAEQGQDTGNLDTLADRFELDATTSSALDDGMQNAADAPSNNSDGVPAPPEDEEFENYQEYIPVDDQPDDFVPEADYDATPVEPEEEIIEPEVLPAFYTINMFYAQIDYSIMEAALLNPDQTERIFLPYAYNGVLSSTFFNEGHVEEFSNGYFLGSDFIMVTDDYEILFAPDPVSGEYIAESEPPDIAGTYMTILEMQEHDFVTEESEIIYATYGELETPRVGGMGVLNITYSQNELNGLQSTFGFAEGETANSIIDTSILQRARDLIQIGNVRRDPFVRIKNPSLLSNNNFGTLPTTAAHHLSNPSNHISIYTGRHQSK